MLAPGLSRSMTCNQSPGFGAAVLEALPLLGGMVRLDRQRPVPRLLRPPARQKTAGACFLTDSFEFRQLHAIVRSDLFQRDLRDQFVDVNEARAFFG